MCSFEFIAESFCYCIVSATGAYFSETSVYFVKNAYCGYNPEFAHLECILPETEVRMNEPILFRCFYRPPSSD